MSRPFGLGLKPSGLAAPAIPPCPPRGDKWGATCGPPRPCPPARHEQTAALRATDTPPPPSMAGGTIVVMSIWFSEEKKPAPAPPHCQTGCWSAWMPASRGGARDGEGAASGPLADHPAGHHFSVEKSDCRSMSATCKLHLLARRSIAVDQPRQLQTAPDAISVPMPGQLLPQHLSALP